MQGFREAVGGERSQQVFKKNLSYSHKKEPINSTSSLLPRQRRWAWSSSQARKSPPPPSAQFSRLHVGLWQLYLKLLFLYKAAHFSPFPTRWKYSEKCGKAHDTTCLEPWPPPGDELASSPGPQKLRDASTSKCGPQPLLCFRAFIQSHLQTFVALLPNTGLTTYPPIYVTHQSQCKKHGG